MDWIMRHVKNLISIHAPREGGDSTNYVIIIIYQRNFNPRPPRGGRQSLMMADGSKSWISIHAPREGGDHGKR